MYENIGKTSFFACFGHLLIDNHDLMGINDLYHNDIPLSIEKSYQMDHSGGHPGGKRGLIGPKIDEHFCTFW